MTGNTHFPLLTFGLFLLLCGCGRSGETDNGAKAPTDLSGAWRLEQRQYPGGGTYLADPLPLTISGAAFCACLPPQ